MTKWMGHRVQMGATLLHNATGTTVVDGWETVLVYCRRELS